MHTDGWRERLAEELKSQKVSMRKASIAAGMHPGWVSELISKGKEPTIEAFAAMCLDCGLRMAYILTGAGKTAAEERFGAFFAKLDPDVQSGIEAMMKSMRKAPPAV